MDESRQGQEQAAAHDGLERAIVAILSERERPYASSVPFVDDFNRALEHLTSGLNWASEEDPDYERPLVAEAHLFRYGLHNAASLEIVLRAASLLTRSPSAVRVLDIGTGTGSTLAAVSTVFSRLPELPTHVDGVEPSDRMFALAMAVLDQLRGAGSSVTLTRHPMRRLQDAAAFSAKLRYDLITAWFCFDKPAPGDMEQQSAAFASLMGGLRGSPSVLVIGTSADRDKSFHLNGLGQELARRGYHLLSPPFEDIEGSGCWSYAEAGKLREPTRLTAWAQERGIEHRPKLDLKFTSAVISRRPALPVRLPEGITFRFWEGGTFRLRS